MSSILVSPLPRACPLEVFAIFPAADSSFNMGTTSSGLQNKYFIP
jgi:hypothetical protein